MYKENLWMNGEGDKGTGEEILTGFTGLGRREGRPLRIKRMTRIPTSFRAGMQWGGEARRGRAPGGREEGGRRNFDRIYRIF
jgi:hypothetical protein